MRSYMGVSSFDDPARRVRGASWHRWCWRAAGYRDMHERAQMMIIVLSVLQRTITMRELGGIRLFREVRGMSPYREEAVVRTVATGEATLLTALSREDVASLG